MFTDIVGFTALMGSDTQKALDLLRTNREIQKPLIEKYGGRWLKEMGDGILAQFNSAIDSVHCALEIQKMARSELNNQIRIGIHLGDVTVENDDVFGDGVNIASRLQAAADPGGIYVSESIHHAIRGSTDIKSQYLGAIQLKNVNYLVNTYYLVDEGLPIPSKSKINELFVREGGSIFKSVYTYIAASIILIVAITFLWVQKNEGQDLQAIAVLPVESLTDKSDQQWLEAGIHHALIDELSKIRALRVVSKTSSMKYLDSDKAIPEIARELNVDGIVEASFSTTGENISIQVRLIKARPEERQIWRKAYDYAMQNILSVYNDVAMAIALEANIPLTAEEEKYFSIAQEINPKAYEAYLRGMSYWEKATKEDLEKAMDYFEHAREIDPDYALAYLGIARVWGGYVQHGFMSAKETRTRREEAFAKAFELDSTLVEVRAKMANAYTWGNWDWDKAGKEFQRIIEINPNYAFSRAYYSHYLAIMGDPEKGLPHSELAIRLDPFNTLYQSIHGMALKNARKYDEALEILQKLNDEEPEHGIGLPAIWAVYHEKGNYEEAFETALKIYSIKNNNTAIKALEAGFEDGGYRMAMQRTAEMMIDYSDSTYFAPWQICTLYCRAEMKEEALDWLERAYEEHDNNMPYINVDPIFDIIKDEERFNILKQKMKFPK